MNNVKYILFNYGLKENTLFLISIKSNVFHDNIFFLLKIHRVYSNHSLPEPPHPSTSTPYFFFSL